jgi:hypothetical protein
MRKGPAGRTLDVMSTIVTARPDSIRTAWQKSPAAWKAAAVLGIAGFVFKLGGSTTRTIDGVADCDGFDAAPFITAAVVLGLTFAGWRTLGSRHVARRPARRVMFFVAAVLVVLAGVHVVRGLVVPAGSFC